MTQLPKWKLAELQALLQYYGLYDGKIDGLMGPKTEQAIEKYNLKHNRHATSQFDEVLMNNIFIDYHNLFHNSELLNRIEAIMNILKTHEVIYGPGRGLFDKMGDQWWITYNPGDVGGPINWTTMTGKVGPSFHCSSLTNFVMSYIYSYNERYTHAGNIPPLFKLLNNNYVTLSNGVKVNGFKGKTIPLIARQQTDNLNMFYITYKELSQRLIEEFNTMPLVIIWSMSDKHDGKWHMDHHVGFFVLDDLATEYIYFAADGYKKNGKYSGNIIKSKTVNPAKMKNKVFRCFGLVSDDILYRDELVKPIEVEYRFTA